MACLSLSQSWWEGKRNKEGKRKWQWLRKGLEPTTCQIASQSLTNWATESPGNSVAEFEYFKAELPGIQPKRIPNWHVRWGGGLEPTTWQMACYAPTNWATESPGNSVAEFEYLRLSCQGSSRSGYQTRSRGAYNLINLIYTPPFMAVDRTRETAMAELSVTISCGLQWSS